MKLHIVTILLINVGLFNSPQKVENDPKPLSILKTITIFGAPFGKYLSVVFLTKYALLNFYRHYLGKAVEEKEEYFRLIVS
ncbi:hypothetical protein [Flavobacterium poyangense]|uniref:hypothetical protein n=1 Tax=Flavobacterium poyangense TaxID=2204302 RepID=UPI00141F6581|nr:hypothetical protein [Flavobacterium sp. JXAS1]